MACKHKEPVVLHKTCTKASLINGHYQLSCILCLTEVICSDLLRIAEKESYASRFLTMCRANDGSKMELLYNEKLILAKVTAIITENLNTDESYYSERLLDVVTILYGYMPDEGAFSKAALNPILFWLCSNRVSINSKLNMVKLLVRYLDRFSLKEENQSASLFCELIRLLNVNQMELSSWILFCSGTCLNKTKLNDPNKLKPLITLLIENLSSMRNDETAVANGLGCLRILLTRESHVSLVLNGQFSNLIRTFINTGLNETQSVTVDFIASILEEDTKGLVMEFVIHSGIAEFLFDMISPNKKYLRQLCTCLQAISQNEKVLSTSLIPHAIERLLLIIDRSKHSDRSLTLDYFKLMCHYVQSYSGAMDLFLNPSIQEQFFLHVAAILHDQSYTSFLMGQSCFYLTLRCERIVRPFPNSLLLSLMDALLVGVERHLGTVQPRTHHTQSQLDEIWTKLKHGCTMFLNLMLSLITFLCKQRADCLTDEKVNMQLETKMVQLFFGKYLRHIAQMFLVHSSKSTLGDRFVQVTNVFLANAQHLPLLRKNSSGVKDISNLVSSNGIRFTIQKSFVYILPLFYRILSRIRHAYTVEKLQVARPMSHELSTNSEIHYSNSEISAKDFKALLSMLTVSCLSVNGIHSQMGASTKEKQNDLATLVQSELGDVQNIYHLLEKGCEYIPELEYDSLDEILRTDANHPSFVPLTATALLVGCVLINRSIIFRDPQSPTSHEQGSLDVLISVPERFLQRMLAFTLQVGAPYFSNLPAILCVELMLTFTSQKSLLMSPVHPHITNPGELLAQAWLILVSALADRITPAHTYLLIRCPGFSEQLQNGEVAWIKFAQTMIFHCHFEDTLFKLQLSKLLEQSYASLSNIWTVWMATFLQGDNVKVCRRLSETVIRILKHLQKNPGDFPTEKTEDQKEAESQFAQYAMECVGTYSTRLPCSLVEFLDARPEMREIYISVLESVIDLFSRHTVNPVNLLKLVQQVINLLPDPSRSRQCSGLRHRLLRLILRCLVRVPDLLFVQIIKLFCSSLRSESLRCFYRVDSDHSTMSLQEHCSHFGMEPMELETVLCLGVLILAASTVLQPASFYEEILNGTIFTDRNFVLSVIRNDPPGPGTCLIQVAGLLCFLLSHDNLARRFLWPPVTEKPSIDFYCALMLCLQTLIMDPIDQFLRYMAIKLFGLLLRETTSDSLEPDSIGYLFLANPWNGIILELLQAGTFIDPLPNLSVHLLELLTAFISTNNPMALIWVDKQVINKTMMVFVHHLDEYPSDIVNGVCMLAQTLSRCLHLGVLNSEEQYAVSVKLSSAGPVEPAPSLLRLFKLYLMETDLD